MPENTIEWIISQPDEFRYQLLDRMRMDCDYHLGNGQIYGSHLWARNEREQIELMKLIWISLPEKPEWLSWEQIEEYEKKMCTPAIEGFTGKYRFLDNFFLCQITFYGLEFTSVEAAFQAAKCKDTELRTKFCSLSPSDAKHLGRTVELRPDWEQKKVLIMNNLLIHKFHENPVLRKKLVSTGVTPLIATNTRHDNYWGDCACPLCRREIGQNMLGELLMDIRKSYTAMCGPEDTKYRTKVILGEDEENPTFLKW